MEIKIEITFNPATMDCKVTGPINDRALSLKALELAGSVLRQYYRKTPEKLIAPRGIISTPPLDLKALFKHGESG